MRLRRVFSLTVLLLPLLIASSAWSSPSNDPPSCLRAFEWSQRFRELGELRAARSYLEACTQPSCREVMRMRCASWLVEVDREIPTVRLVVRGVAPAELIGAQAFIDGELVKDGLGAAVAVDPREHVARVLLRDGRQLSSRFTPSAGAKDQAIELRPAPVRVPVPRAPVAPVPRAPAAPERDDSVGVGLTITGFSLAGAGIIVGAITGAMSIARFDTLSDQCQASGCTQEEIDDGRALGHASTVSFAIAAGGAAIGIVGIVLLTTNGASVVEATLGPARLSLTAAF